MVIGGAPPFALIVKDAAGVEAEIAADRAHVALGGAGDVAGGLRQYRIMLDDRRMLGQRGQPHRGADLKCIYISLDGGQLRHLVHVDEHWWGDDAAADIHDQIGAAAERHAARIGGARGQRLVERGRIEHAEIGQGVHQAPPFFFVAFSSARLRFSIASNTRSGVTGRSLKRMPMASAMALVSAGRNAASEPSPASLAPNGPCGSMLSTIPTSIGGESWIVESMDPHGPFGAKEA